MRSMACRSEARPASQFNRAHPARGPRRASDRAQWHCSQRQRRGGSCKSNGETHGRSMIKNGSVTLGKGSARREARMWREDNLHAGRRPVVKERRSETELRQMMLAAARNHEECAELDDLFIFGPTPRPDANWGF